MTTLGSFVSLLAKIRQYTRTGQFVAYQNHNHIRKIFAHAGSMAPGQVSGS
jgi:hypothetical protein